MFTTRAQFSLGRDLKLSPAQGGRPLNYFVFPYVEVDGQEYPNVSLAFSLEDANAAAAATQYFFRDQSQRFEKYRLTSE